MRTMFDAVSPANIPADAQLVAGYINGRYAWKPQDWARFPHALKVTIAVSADADARCLDVETYDATPAQAPGWVARQRTRGNPHPWVYCSESVWAECRRQFAVQGEPEPIWWIAGYPGSVGWAVYPGAHAHQVIDDGPYDRSLVADYIPGLDPDPVATIAAPEPPPEDIMRFTFFTFGPDPAHLGWFRSDGTWIAHIRTPLEGDDSRRIIEEMGAKWVNHANSGGPGDTGVSDPLAFGRPIDAETATALGVAAPA